MITDETALHVIEGQDQADIAQGLQVASALVAAKFTQAVQSMLGSPVINHVRMDIVLSTSYDDMMEQTTITAHATNVVQAAVIAPSPPPVYSTLGTGVTHTTTGWTHSPDIVTADLIFETTREKMIKQLVSGED